MIGGILTSSEQRVGPISVFISPPVPPVSFSHNIHASSARTHSCYERGIPLTLLQAIREPKPGLPSPLCLIDPFHGGGQHYSHFMHVRFIDWQGECSRILSALSSKQDGFLVLPELAPQHDLEEVRAILDSLLKQTGRECGTYHRP